MALKDLYSQYESLYSQTPEAMADPEQYYTPEMQEAVLAELTQQATDTRNQNQASISGAAIQSGFGVGGSSRESTRRAKADAQALDEIIQGSVQQAASIESMRQEQLNQQRDLELQASEDKKNQDLAFKLAKQGYQANLSSAQQAISDEDRASRQDALLGGIGSIAGGAASLFGNIDWGKTSSGAYSPSLGITSPSAAAKDMFQKQNFWEVQQ